MVGTAVPAPALDAGPGAVELLVHVVAERVGDAGRHVLARDLAAVLDVEEEGGGEAAGRFRQPLVREALRESQSADPGGNGVIGRGCACT